MDSRLERLAEALASLDALRTTVEEILQDEERAAVQRVAATSREVANLATPDTRSYSPQRMGRRPVPDSFF